MVISNFPIFSTDNTDVYLFSLSNRIPVLQIENKNASLKVQHNEKYVEKKEIKALILTNSKTNIMYNLQKGNKQTILSAPYK